MNINEFIRQYHNHPVLFIGTGFSLRYLDNSYSWDGLLKLIGCNLKKSNEYYYDVKSKHSVNGTFLFPEIGSEIERDFNQFLIDNRDGEFKNINDLFYQNMEQGTNISRFKLYVSALLSEIQISDGMITEIKELKKARKNISSIITTNYDKLIEEIFEFNPLIGNDILLSNPYGALYKIHGCVSKPEKIILSKEDYDNFNLKYELIRAQLLSLFIHNPIIFLGYSINDSNIKDLLKIIFTYVEPNSELASKIRQNFLLVEYEKNSDNLIVSDYDVDIDGLSTIRINKLKTDDFSTIYKAIASLELPISTMDIRKVESIIKEIHEGGKIKISITDDLDQLDNDDKVLVLGSKKTITYTYQTSAEMMAMYFKIIDESNTQILELVDKFTIQKNQYFPIYGFAKINRNIVCTDILKQQQQEKLEHYLAGIKDSYKVTYQTIDEVLENEDIPKSNKIPILFYSIMKGAINIELVENYLRKSDNKKTTDYRKILCAYDYLMYKE